MNRYQLRFWLRRCATAWRYAIGRTTDTDEWNLFHYAEERLGQYSLEGLSERAVLDQAVERYGDHPELPELVSRACSRVADKWNSDGHLTGAAEDWAFDLIAEYAADDGIVLNDTWTAEGAPT